MQLAIIALYVGVASARKSFISLNDNECDREDPEILAELKRRTNHDDLIRAFKPLKFKIPSAATQKPRLLGNQSTLSPTGVTNYRRKYDFGTKFHKNYIGDVSERASRHKMIEIVEQAIYGAQYRIKDLEPIAKHYVDKVEFRINFIFKRMETIETELEFMYSHMYNAGHLWDPWSGAKMRVFLYIVYYEMALMKNIDVQYMCDHLFRLHQAHEKIMREMRQKYKRQKKGNQGANQTGSQGGSEPTPGGGTAPIQGEGKGPSQG